MGGEDKTSLGKISVVDMNLDIGIWIALELGQVVQETLTKG